jgi:mannosyl-oligosaccharide alpha-1,2-mannosidase
MDHLVCFMPGVMALGAYTDPQGVESPRAQRDLSVAKALMFTCREMYHRTETGISPEFVLFPPGKDIDTRTSAPFYILRPETAESLFVLNQLTGDPIYREWAYEIWTAIDKHCRIGAAYGALRNVNTKNGGVDNRMESFFLAETLKYLYLAQDPDNEIDVLHKYVFNTEAHPTRIFDDGLFPTNHIPIGKSS